MTEENQVEGETIEIGKDELLPLDPEEECINIGEEENPEPEETQLRLDEEVVVSQPPEETEPEKQHVLVTEVDKTQTLKERRVVQSVPLDEDECEQCIIELLTNKTLPAPEMYGKLLEYVEEKQIDMMVKNDYEEAGRYRNAEEMLYGAINSEKNRTGNEYWAQSIDKRIEQVNARINQVNEDHNKRIEHFRKVVAQRREEIENRHADELTNFEAYWSSPDILAQYSKGSKQLLQLRQVQRNQALARDFDAALRTKKLADDIQLEEEAQAQQRAMQSMRAAHKILLEKQARELQIASENWVRHEQDLCAQKDQEIAIRRMVISQLEMRKNSGPPKWGRGRIEENTRARSVPDAQRLPMNPNCRMHMVNYRTSNDGSKLRLPELDVGNCLHPAKSSAQTFRPRAVKRFRCYR
jgi:hypothetical protein